MLPVLIRENLSGRTYAEKGSNTVWAKAEKSGWDKRQATIQLTVFGDGTILKPWILFKGKGQLPEAKMSQYDKRVTVKFNTEKYANESIILEWIQEQLIPVIHRDINTPNTLASNETISIATGLATGVPFPSSEAPGLISLNAASFHKTPAVKAALHTANITPCMIHGGCTCKTGTSYRTGNLREALDNNLDAVTCPVAIRNTIHRRKS